MDAGDGGDLLASDDIGGGVKVPRVKVVLGADGTNDGDVASGNPMPVDIISEIPAGTKAIGKLAANSGVDIGDVDVTSVPAPLNVVGGGTEAAAQRVTIANDSTGLVSVDDGGGALTVDGTITEASGAAIATSVAIMDDWDESDRAMVNVIVGQAGIAAGEGVDGVTVPRVSLATDVALPAGANAIGKLAANSGVDIGDVDVTSAPARDRTTDNVGVAVDSSHLMADTTALEVKRINIDMDDTGITEIVAAVGGKIIRVVSLSIFASEDTVEVNFTDDTPADIFGSTERAVPLDVTGAAGAGGFVLGYNPIGWFETAVGKNLSIELSAAKDICGSLAYVEV
jgi:hypothetical protein